MRLRLPLALSLLAAPALAQATSYTVPYGLDTAEGNAVSYHWAGDRVLQVVDMTNPRLRVLQQIAFRRDDQAQTPATAGAMDVVVTMAQCEWSRISTAFKDNWQTNAVQVLNAKNVSVPDWRVRAKSPAPFDFVLKFANPWLYRGQTALVWTIAYANSTAGVHRMDRDCGTYLFNVGQPLSRSCGSWYDYVRFWNTGNYAPFTGFHLEVGVSSDRPNTPVFVMLDTSDRQLKVPGLCTDLHTLPTFLFYLGTTDGKGNLPDVYLSFPWVWGVEGGDVFTQTLAPDATMTGIKLGLSGGRRTTIPVNPSGYGHQTCYLWAEGSDTATAIGRYVFYGGAPVAELR
ncbi:MAG: hypothetical protein R3F30_01525 [Planctomycetota bacterium]